MSNVIKIEWDDYPAMKLRRGQKAKPEYDAVRALKIGEASKFPCTWNHSVRFGKYDICSGKQGAFTAIRNQSAEKYIEAVCTDKMIYVRRTEDRAVPISTGRWRNNGASL